MQTLPFLILTLLIAMTSVQSGATLAKQLFPHVGAIGAAGLRISLAALMMGVVWRPWRGRLSRTELCSLALYGTSLGLMNLLFYIAIETIPLGIGVALEFTGPLAVALAGSRRMSDFFWVALAVIGLLLLLPPSLLQPTSETSTSLDPVGVAYALGAGCCWALYILFGQKAGASMHSGRAACLGMWAAAITVLPFSLFTAGTKLLNIQLLPLALLVALTSSALPYTLEMFVLKKLPAKTFGILMSLEPVIAAISGLVFLQERLSLLQCSAVGCIIAASAGSSWSLRRKEITGFALNDSKNSRTSPKDPGASHVYISASGVLATPEWPRGPH